MTANDLQVFLLQDLSADTPSRRRSQPPSLLVPLSQPVNQRWRERPRCLGLRVAPGHRDGVVHAIVGCVSCRCLCAQVVQEECGAGVHVFVSRFAGRSWAETEPETRSGTSNVFPAEPSSLQTEIQTSHHRAFDTGAVLSVVNALRCASTRPAAGPAGIDDTSARHVPGTYAMVLRVSTTQIGLTRGTRRRMLASSRQCRMALPSFASRANGARIRPAPTGHGIERNSTLADLMHNDRDRLVAAPIELRTSGLLASYHPQDHASRRGCVHQRIALGRLNARRSNHSRSSPRGA
jgi:hypothetical protein